MREYKSTIREYVKHKFLNLSHQIIVEVVESKSSTQTIMEKIQRHGDSYVVINECNNTVLRKHKTKSSAIKHIAAIEASKAASMDEGLRDIGRGLAQGGALGAVTLGLALGGQNKEPSVAPPPDTGVIGLIVSGPNQKVSYDKETIVDTAKKVVRNNREQQATLHDHSNHLAEYEGFRGGVYNDHKGNATVGYGHMFKSDSQSTWKSAGIGDLHDDVQAGKAKLSEADARRLLHHELKTTYIPRAKKLVPRYDDLDKDSQVAVVGSTFRGGFSGSPKTIKHLNDGNFEKTADEFLKNKEYIESKKAGTGVYKRMDLYHTSWKNGRYVR